MHHCPWCMTTDLMLFQFILSKSIKCELKICTHYYPLAGIVHGTGLQDVCILEAA